MWTTVQGTRFRAFALQSIEETKVRLAYDFYYLKHRSLGLDIIIALKTFKRMFFRVSSW
jgi:lipopolysaccharide/colanic/teichoic acid biosynthesis glycosyltransferase